MTFNSEEYGWNDITLVMLGRPVITLRRVRYKVAQVKDNVYGKGKLPIARARGNVTFEGDLTILHSDLRALLTTVGNRDNITSIRPFDIVVNYGPLVGIQSTDILKYCEFMEQEIDVKQADPFTEIPLPIVIGDIQFNA
jgi:hypothetical protein